MDAAGGGAEAAGRGRKRMCVFTFFKKHDWAGKTVKPFATHEGSGLGGSVRAIRILSLDVLLPRVD